MREQSRLKKMKQGDFSAIYAASARFHSIDADEDIHEYMTRQRQAKALLKSDKEDIKRQLKEIFQGVMPYDLRMYYIPVRETCNAYNEGKYEIVNKYVEVMATNFKQDVYAIKGLYFLFSDKELIPEMYVSYVTDEEMHMIDELIRKDDMIRIIPDQKKEILKSMANVKIDGSYI